MRAWPSMATSSPLPRSLLADFSMRLGAALFSMWVGCGGTPVDHGTAGGVGGGGGATTTCQLDCPCPEVTPELGAACAVADAEVCLYPDIMGCSALYACRAAPGDAPRWDFIGGATSGSTCWCGRCETGDDEVDTCPDDATCYEAACGEVVVTLCRQQS